MGEKLTPAAYYLLRPDGKGGTQEQLIGKVLAQPRYGLIFLHVQYGNFHNKANDCPYPLDSEMAHLLLAGGVEIVCHFEGPKVDGPERERRRGPEGETRDTLWVARVEDIVRAPMEDYAQSGTARRYRYFLHRSRAQGDGGWVGLSPVEERRVGHSSTRAYFHKGREIIVSPYLRARVDLAPATQTALPGVAV